MYFKLSDLFCRVDPDVIFYNINTCNANTNICVSVFTFLTFIVFLIVLAKAMLFWAFQATSFLCNFFFSLFSFIKFCFYLCCFTSSACSGLFCYWSKPWILDIRLLFSYASIWCSTGTCWTLLRHFYNF